MIERASWRQSPADPRTPLGVFYGRERLLGLPVGAWLALYGATVGLVSGFLPHGLAAPLMIVALMPLWSDRKDYHRPRSTSPRLGFRRSLALAATNPFALLTVDRMDAVADLAPLPAPEACYGAEITLRRGERTTGGDLGVVVFSEGWLVYEGRTTSFSLSPGDVRQASPENADWTLYLPEGQNLTLRSYDEGWSAAGRAWLAAPPPDGLSRLPPLAPNAIRRLRTAGYFHLAAAVVAGLGTEGVVSTLLAGRLGAVGRVGFLALLIAVLYGAGTLLARRRR